MRLLMTYGRCFTHPRPYKPALVIAVITGMRKPWRTVFSERDYQRVRELGRDHQQNYPRRIAT
jgi:hypothetical protein